MLFDISVSLGRFSFTFCILKYILNDCYVTGKWHSYFSNYLVYRFISFRARRDHYDLQSCGQKSSPDDSSLKPRVSGRATIHLHTERNPVITRKHQMLENLHHLRVPRTCAGCLPVFLSSHPKSIKGAAHALQRPAPSSLSLRQSSAYTRK